MGGQRHASTALPPGKKSVTHFTGGWVGLRAGLYVCRKSGPHRLSIPGPTDHPARVESPCRLRCPGPHVQTTLGVLILLLNGCSCTCSCSYYSGSVVDQWIAVLKKYTCELESSFLYSSDSCHLWITCTLIFRIADNYLKEHQFIESALVNCRRTGRQGEK